MEEAALQAGSRCRKYAACGKIVNGTNFWFGLKAIARNVFGKELGCCGVTQCVYSVTTHPFEFVDGVNDGNYVLQRDNASIHRARAVKDFLTDLNITTMDWPAISLDPNLIENLWGLMAREMYKNGRQYSTVSELKDAVLAAWDEITTDLLVKLSKSTSDWCISVLRRKGKRIVY